MFSIRVDLPHFDKYEFFQEVNLKLQKTWKGTSKESPKR